MPGVKARVAGVLCAPLVGRALRRVYRDRVPCRLLAGARIETASPVVLDRTVAAIYWGIYESAELRFVAQHLRGDLDAIEFGSSIGVVSLGISRRLEPGRRLVCVEADARLHELLGRNARAESRGEVEIVNAAIDYEREEVPFALGDSSTGGFLAEGDGGAAGRAVEPVRATTLSALVAQHAVGDFVLVCDIEGAEVGLIDRDGEALARCQQLVLELHPGRLAGRNWSIEDLHRTITERHGMREIAAHGCVYVFER
jgi:FkbM family methyltransferase